VIEAEQLCIFFTSSELEELSHAAGSGDNLARKEIRLRAITRRDRYPLLWEGLHRHRIDHPAIPKPWSVEAEIEALRKDVAIMWEGTGLALDLAALTPDDLTVLDHLQPKWTGGLAYWQFVACIATPTEIEAVLAKVLLVSRAIDRNKFDIDWETTLWEDVGRPLNWQDLDLDPATFPWDVWRRCEERRKVGGAPTSWRRWSMQPCDTNPPDA
jgi:hypothetical protein